MNIVCVYSVDDFFSASKPLVAQFQIPYGISYIITVLQNAGHNVELLVFTPETDLGLIKDTIDNFNPRLFCFSSVYTQFNMICNLAGEVKRINQSIYTAIGGVNPTLNPKEVISKTCFDAICIGEGERAMVRLAESLEATGNASNIDNMWFRRADNAIEMNPQNPFIEDLDSLPFINRDIWLKWINFPERQTSVLVGRGCPYRCSYCSNHALSKVSKGKYVRFRSVGNIIEEVKLIKAKFAGTSLIYFEVETLGANLNYTFELCDALSAMNDTMETPLQFGTNFAINRNLMANIDDLAEKLRRANFKYVNVGLESGSYRVRKDVLRRPDYNNEDIIKFCNVLRGKGIKVNLYVIIGLPTETPEEFKETVECVRNCYPNHVFLSIYYPYPGTDLHKFTVEKGYLKPFEADGLNHSERKSVYLKLAGFTEKQILQEYYLFYHKVFKNKWPLYKTTAHIIRNMMASNSKADRFYRMMLSRFRILGLLRSKLTNNNI